jgi:hypothetical protein
MTAKLIKYVYDVHTRRDDSDKGKYVLEYLITVDGPPPTPRKARDKAYAVMGTKLDYKVGFKIELRNPRKDCYQEIPGWVAFRATVLPEIS